LSTLTPKGSQNEQDGIKFYSRIFTIYNEWTKITADLLKLKVKSIRLEITILSFMFKENGLSVFFGHENNNFQ